MNTRIDTITGRNKLVPRTEPYWHKLSIGQYLGYRKLADGSGRWIARETVNRKNKYEALKCDEKTSFSDAQKIARQFFANSNGIKDIRYTVLDAIDDYIDHLMVENSVRSAKECRQRLTKHVSESLEKITLANLTSLQVKSFRDNMVIKQDNDDLESKERTRKSRDSANRVMGMFKAAMNLAYRNGFINTDAPWKKVPSFRCVGRSRKIFLTDDQVSSLLSVTTGQFRQLLQVALNTGARYGELRTAKVVDFDGKQKTLRLTGKTGTRTVFLSEQAIGILTQASKLKHPNAFLLVKDDAQPWGEKDHSRRFKDAVVNGGLLSDTVFYCLRHYHISKALLARVSTQVIAENCGTSIKMIESHYGKFMNDDRVDMLNKIQIVNSVAVS